MNSKNDYEKQNISDVNMGVDDLFYPSKKKLLNDKKDSKIKIIGKRFNLKKEKKSNIETTNSGLVKRKIELNTEKDNDDFDEYEEEKDEEVIIGVNNKKNKTEFETKYDKFSKDDLKSLKEKRAKKQVEKNRIRKAKSIIVLMVFIAMFIYLITSPIFNLTQIEVKGNKILNSDTYISLSKLELNKNIYKVTKKQIKKNIKENAYVDDVIINRTLPSKIVINIKERIPQFMIEYMGSYMYIDSDGNMLDLSIEKKNLPIILGISTEEIKVGQKLSEDDVEKLNTVTKIIDVAKSYQIDSKIDKIDISNVSNYVLYLENDAKVAYIGDASNIITRILYLKGILERESGIAGEIYINGNLNSDNIFFRERV